MKKLIIILMFVLIGCNEEPADHIDDPVVTAPPPTVNVPDDVEDQEEKPVLTCPTTGPNTANESWRDDYLIFGREGTDGELDGYVFEFDATYRIWNMEDDEGDIVACGSFGLLANVGSWQGGKHNRWDLPFVIITASGTQSVTCVVFSFEDGANIVTAEAQPVPAGESEFYMACPGSLYDTDISYHFRSY